jgi:hypothetical protein
MTKLTVDDIADLREYEREREDFRADVIKLKKVRRVTVGPFITLVFENRQTIRFQIQEMARAEKLITDEAIRTELDVYNPLIPDPGTLRATLFIELTNEEDLKSWLPKLVGIETEIELRVGESGSERIVRCDVDPEHEERLTRDEITASVHYVGFALSDEAVAAFESGPVTVAVTHPAYQHEVTLTDATRASLNSDLRPSA